MIHNKDNNKLIKHLFPRDVTYDRINYMGILKVITIFHMHKNVEERLSMVSKGRENIYKTKM